MKRPKTIKSMRETFDKLMTDTESDGKESIKVISDSFNDWLDELNSNDWFGTEGQNDPRGDNRN